MQLIILIIITLVIFVRNSFPGIIPFLITTGLKNVKTGSKEEKSSGEKTEVPRQTVMCRKFCRKWIKLGESRKLIGKVQVLVERGEFTKFTKGGCIEQSRVTTVV